MKKINKIFIVLIICISLISCSEKKKTLKIAAAADLQYAMEEIKTGFVKKYPDIKVDIIYGSSGNLYQQIVNKAPFNVFFSADISYPGKLDSLHLAGSKPKLYAIGHLVLWASKFNLSEGVDLLKDMDVKKIAIANPKVAPYGKRAKECLEYYKLYDLVKDKIVEGENVSQAAQFVLTGNADVGIIALSLALSPKMKNRGTYILLDEQSYSRLEQAYIIIKGSEENQDVLKFIQYAETKEALEIFGKYGFNLPDRK